MNGLPNDDNIIASGRSIPPNGHLRDLLTSDYQSGNDIVWEATVSRSDPNEVKPQVDEKTLWRASRRYAKTNGVSERVARTRLLDNPELIAKWQ